MHTAHRTARGLLIFFPRQSPRPSIVDSRVPLGPPRANCHTNDLTVLPTYRHGSLQPGARAGTQAAKLGADAVRCGWRVPGSGRDAVARWRRRRGSRASSGADRGQPLPRPGEVGRYPCPGGRPVRPRTVGLTGSCHTQIGTVDADHTTAAQLPLLLFGSANTLTYFLTAGLVAMPRSLSRSCCAGLKCVESNCGWPVVAGAGGLAGFLDPVLVVPGPFDGAGTGAFPAGRDQ